MVVDLFTVAPAFIGQLQSQYTHALIPLMSMAKLYTIYAFSQEAPEKNPKCNMYIIFVVFNLQKSNKTMPQMWLLLRINLSADIKCEE